MHVERFIDQIELLAQAQNITVDEAREQLDLHQEERPWWIAVQDGRGRGAATVWHGPDGRRRLYFGCRDSAAYAPLTAAAASAVSGPIHASVGGGDALRRGALTSHGFVLEYIEDVYEAEFARALRGLAEVRTPEGFRLVGADRVDLRRWFTLDNTLRQDVRGTEGWRGDFVWFGEENPGSPYFDPSAYLVAVDESNEEYAGLVRIWNGPAELPRLGMLGVLRQYRRIGLGRALLARAVEAAAAWRAPAFTGESSRDAAGMVALWRRLGASARESRIMLVRR